MTLHSTAVSRTFEERRRPVDLCTVALDADGIISEGACASACLAMAQQPLPENRAR
jgi:hypothetical protein